MKAVYFKESNIRFAEGQKEYHAIDAYKLDGSLGEIITCWKLTFRERITMLFKGLLWHSQLNFNKPMTPIILTPDGPGLISSARIRSKENPTVDTNVETKKLIAKLSDKKLMEMLKGFRHQAIFIQDELSRREKNRLVKV